MVSGKQKAYKIKSKNNIGEIFATLKLSLKFNLILLPGLLVIFCILSVFMDKTHNNIFLRQISATEQTLSQVQKQQNDYVVSSYEKREKQISSLLIEIAKEPIAALDMVALNNYTKIATQDDRIAYAAYYSEDGILLSYKGILRQDLQKKVYPISSHGIKLGELVLGISNKIIEKQKETINTLSSNKINRMRELMKGSLDNITTTMFVSSIVVLLLIAMSSYLLFYTLVGKPLQSFKNVIKKLQNNDYAVYIPFKNKRDEIGKIALALDDFKVSLSNVDKLQKEQIQKNKELRAAKEKVEKIAYIDEITQISNRACFKKDFHNLFFKNSVHEQYSLINIEIDNIAKINDTMGHNAGDTILRQFCHRIEILLSHFKTGKVYRWCGNEFVILINTINEKLISEICSAITESTREALNVRNTPVFINLNVGVASLPDDSNDLESLLVHAHLARYKSRESGPNNFHFYTEALKSKIENEIRVEEELRTAILEKQLFLTYQPQIDNTSGQVTGVECLIRWQHPTKGILTPYAFLNVIENTELAPIVGRYVFDEALSTARKWLDQKIEFGKMAINLSPRHLQHGTLLEDLQASMDQYDVSSEYITAEILESLLIDENDSQLTEVQKLHDLGVNIELDDFGTGYASLSHLSQLPIHGLKIDRSFTQKMMTDKKKEVVIQTLLNMAKMMNLNVVCEGVETVQQMDKIRTYGNCSLQGYLITKPENYDHITNMLKTGIDLDSLRNLNKKSA